MLHGIKHALLGNPLETSALVHQRLNKVRAMALLANDALSSVAYAIDEIILVLAATMLMGATNWTLPIAGAITALLFIVGLSYRQTIFAYPQGGGSYTVAKDNLGQLAGLIAASSLLVDYLLTVAVSIASGLANVASAFPALNRHVVLWCLLLVAALTLAHLRGIKESAAIFALPTYLFIGSMGLLLLVGWYRFHTGTLHIEAAPVTPTMQAVGIFAILRAFSSGCTAMTGVEAISNGVPVFERPERRNAAITLVWMVVLLAVMFMGSAALAHVMGVGIREDQTVLAQVSRGVFGNGIPFYVVQISTLLVLVFAANTSFADFPRLSSIIARDGFLPRQLSGLGDRLVFSNGIILLGVLAGLLLVVFEGDTHALIPLFAIGAFNSFTMSQAGMAVHWWRLRHEVPGWRVKLFINGLGALVTGVITVVIVVTKFSSGAWIVAILIPALVYMFLGIRRHYDRTQAQLTLQGLSPDKALPQVKDNTALVLVANVHRGIFPALAYARSLSPDARAVYIDINGDGGRQMREVWQTWGQGMPLVVLPSPYRSITEPLIAYIRELQAAPQKIVTVILPEFVTSHWWENALHNQTALLIKWALLFAGRRVITTSVPSHLD